MSFLMSFLFVRWLTYFGYICALQKFNSNTLGEGEAVTWGRGALPGVLVILKHCLQVFTALLDKDFWKISGITLHILNRCRTTNLNEEPSVCLFWISGMGLRHLYSLIRDFWRHFGLCRAAAHSDCCFFCAVYKYSFLLTYLQLRVTSSISRVLESSIRSSTEYSSNKKLDSHSPNYLRRCCHLANTNKTLPGTRLLVEYRCTYTINV